MEFVEGSKTMMSSLKKYLEEMEEVIQRGSSRKKCMKSQKMGQKSYHIDER